MQIESLVLAQTYEMQAWDIVLQMLVVYNKEPEHHRNGDSDARHPPAVYLRLVQENTWVCENRSLSKLVCLITVFHALYSLV
jgi:hypothetical protein